MMHTTKSIIADLREMGIEENTVLMVHSSLRSIGDVQGGGSAVLDALCASVQNGLLIVPTHTWASIKEDGDMFDVETSASCVGALTNLARQDERFIRSSHPTHSVCATGRDSREYIHLDDNAHTPTPPNGCFGVLKEKQAKILFLGAPLSKNTFVHSIEEYMNVPNRFTASSYKFYSKRGYSIVEYQMVRHYNKDCPHISDNYEKLLPIMLKLGIATAGKVGDATSYLVDAKGCFDLVCHILKKDIDALSDMRDIETYTNDFK